MNCILKKKERGFKTVTKRAGKRKSTFFLSKAQGHDHEFKPISPVLHLERLAVQRRNKDLGRLQSILHVLDGVVQGTPHAPLVEHQRGNLPDRLERRLELVRLDALLEQLEVLVAGHLLSQRRGGREPAPRRPHRVRVARSRDAVYLVRAPHLQQGLEPAQNGEKKLVTPK